ncbi:ribonuclease P protein component [Spiroplasma endosymbiont of Crioceris asparagi]|uniref:ribonuclease P protein component n=1 Tax=Spiroplasma endosymbiont of Crioceris asparagi TaxID=3066286 RepID=UPI0030D45342
MKNKRIIKKNYDFQEIISKKNIIKSYSYNLFATKNDLGYFRYGISVGKKNWNAVERNKIKRQIRMMIKNILKQNVFENSNDLIIIVKLNYNNNDFAKNEKDLNFLFKKLVKKDV